MNPVDIILIGLVLFSLAMLASLPASIKREKERKQQDEYYELNRKQFNRGVDTNNLNTAKDALSQLEYGYSEIKGHVNRNSASCYEEDIRDVRSNIDGLVEEKWSEKAEKLLDGFLSTYYMITNPTFSDIEKAYKSKAKCLHQYDAYWDWTRQVHEENKESLNQLNLWNEAKQMFKNAFYDSASAEDNGIVNWSDGATRQRIEKRLSDCIYAMQPVYRAKSELREKILRRIRNAKSIQRSKLLGGRFEGFVKAEVNACYKGLLHDRCIVEIKQGSLWFVSLTDKGEKACNAKAASSAKKPDKQTKKTHEEKVQPKIIEEVADVSDMPAPAEEGVAAKCDQMLQTIKQNIANLDQQQEQQADPSPAAAAITTVAQLLAYLELHQIKWVDKRSAGGCLWVISTTETDALLADLQLDGKRFRKAKTRHFVASDGWFMQK